ncbi:MAG: hypothetical protein ACI4ME_11465 [Aristaeellaceae bacterium]
MGYTFAAALVKKCATAPATRKALRKAMENLGYRRAASAENAALTLKMYQDRKSAWLSLAMEIPDDLEEETAFLRSVAAEMRTPILYFINLDSDFLLMIATDGQTVQQVHVGFCDEDEDVPPDSEDLSLFDALLPDDEARAEFRRILAVDEEERVFSESAAEEMAALFGYTPEVLFIDEDAPPFAALHFDMPGGEAVPFLAPEDAPPAFTKALAVLSCGNPATMMLHSCGGKGKGIRVILQAVGYDARDWELLPLELTNRGALAFAHRGEETPYSEQADPKRVKFQDGTEGWEVLFPDVPIPRGVNPASPQATSPKAGRAYFENGLLLTIAFRGGSCRTPREQPEDFYVNPPDGETLVWVIPLENPQAPLTHRIPREQLRRGQDDQMN